MVTLLPGLLTAVLPALEEQDNALQKLVFDFLADVNKAVGDRFYIATLWLIILKNSKNRLSCFKILNKKFGDLAAKSPSGFVVHENLNEEMKIVATGAFAIEGKPESLYPSPWMVVNGLIKCIEDEDLQVRKTTLDFMTKYAKLDNQLEQ